VLAIAFFLVSLCLAWRSPQRATFLGGLALILGGYGLTLCFRLDVTKATQDVVDTRYHLFPHLGLVLVLAVAIAAGLRRGARRPARACLAVMGLVAFLAVTHSPGLAWWTRYFRCPEQARTLAAVERLGSICTEQGITRAQALNALDPIHPSWAGPYVNPLELLQTSTALAAHPDGEVRPLLLGALTADERAALCGGMDASPYLVPITASSDLSPASVGRLEGAYQLRRGQSGEWIAPGKFSFLQYAVVVPSSPGLLSVRALGLTADMPGASIELWWRGDHTPWSETRSIQCRIEPGGNGPDPGRDWMIAIDRLPHWEPGSARHYRFLFRSPGTIAVGAPRLLR
jgi:hypothetical protein